MKNIINIDVNDKEIHIKIDGDNIDILDSMVLILKKMEEESGLTIETSLRYLNKYLEVDNDERKGYTE